MGDSALPDVDCGGLTQAEARRTHCMRCNAVHGALHLMQWVRYARLSTARRFQRGEHLAPLDLELLLVKNGGCGPNSVALLASEWRRVPRLEPLDFRMASSRPGCFWLSPYSGGCSKYLGGISSDAREGLQPGVTPPSFLLLSECRKRIYRKRGRNEKGENKRRKKRKIYDNN